MDHEGCLKQNREGFWESTTKRECTICHTIFVKTSRMTICKECNVSRVISLSPDWKMWNRAKVRAKKKGIEFNLEVSDCAIPSECPVLGITLMVHKGRSGGESASPALDRIDNSKGYVKGNVQVISHQANVMKANATREQLVKFARWVLNEIV